MKKGRYYSMLLFLLISRAIFSQDLQWEWASFATSKVSSRHFENISCGFHNELYAVCPYDTLLMVGDTAIRHPEMYGGSPVNCAVLKFDADGRFSNLIDIYTLPGSTIYNTFTGADENANLYLASTFSRRLFILDTFINHCNTPYIDAPDGLIVRIDKTGKINWAKTIGGTLSDQIDDLVISQTGDAYVLSSQTASSNYPSVVDFFQQDTVYSDHDFTSISRLDKDGILSWRTDFSGEFGSTNLILEENKFLYFWGSAMSDIIINDDTIVNPGSSNESRTFIACFDTTGNLTRSEFSDLPDYVRSMDVNSSGNMYISGIIYDTLIIGTDTTIVPQDLIYYFIGMFDTLYQPLWYHIIPTIANQQLGSFDLETDGDDLIFSSYSNRNVQLADTVLAISGNRKAFAGVFDSFGNLKEVTISSTSGEFWTSEMILDKCKNPILAGGIRGKIYLYEDTATTYSVSFLDGALVKINRNEPPPIYLGPDTSSCNDYLLAGPQGYQQYSLNDSLIGQNTCTITKTGSYVFGCSNEGCWAYDTIFIDIHPGITFGIGDDMTIFSSDTIVFSVPAIYDSVIWFDGSDSNTHIIYAKDFPPGVIPIWAEVFSGPCSDADTLLLTIISDYGVEETESTGITAFPNPFKDHITVGFTVSIKKLNIFDDKGNLCYSREFNDETKSILVNTEGLKKGVYMLNVITRDDSVFTGKIVKF